MICKHPDGWSWIRNSTSVKRASGPCWQTSKRLNLNCDSCIKEKRVRTGIHIVRTVAAIFSYMNLERIWSLVEYWEASERVAETSKRMQAGTEASRYSGGSRRKSTSSERMMLGLLGIQTVWHVVRTDETVDRWASRRDDTSSGRLTWLAESSETLLNSGIPVKQHLYKQVILSKQNEVNHKLTVL